jgi:hypothetical protein
VHRLLEALDWTAGRAPERWCEPAAGGGAIVKAVNQKVLETRWIAVEKDFDSAADLQPLLCERDHFILGDFLDWPGGFDFAPEVVIGNPPYSLAEAFVRRSRSLWPGAQVMFLLRLGFLASAERASLWADAGHPDVYVLPDRPSFTGDGRTDGADYAWYVWGSETRRKWSGELRVLGRTPVADRRPRKPNNHGYDGRIVIPRAAIEEDAT